MINSIEFDGDLKLGQRRGLVRTLSVISFSNPAVNALEASSRCRGSPQFLESDSDRVSVYSCTFAFR